MYDIITIGGLIYDIIFLIDKGKVLKTKPDSLKEMLCFKCGAKIYIKKAFRGPGGGAGNAAASFSRLGLKTAVISCLGNDVYGKVLIDSLQKNKIETRFIQKTNKALTGFSLINSLESGDLTIFSFRGADEKLKMPDFKKIKTKWFYLSSLATPIWQKILKEVLKIKNVKIAFNPGQVQIESGFSCLKSFLPKIDVLILNQDEARELVFSANKKTETNLKSLAKIISSWGPKITVITAGKKGAGVLGNGNYFFRKPFRVKPANTTGAGDAFASAFVSSLYYKPNDLKRAFFWGIKNSASVIKKFGAQNGLLTLKELKNGKK